MTDQDELMQFDFGGPKKPGKKPPFGNRNKKPLKNAKNKTQEQQSTLQEQPQQIQNTTQPPLNQQKTQERSLPAQNKQQQNQPAEQNQDEGEASLKTLLTSKKFAEREKGYTQLLQWSDPTLTKADFIRDAHNYAKEKHFKVLGSLLTALDSVVNDTLFQQNLNFPSFYQNLLECMMSNAKKQTLEQLNKFICDFWDQWDNKDQFIEEIKKHLGSKKVKIQEKSCSLILELLNGGNIKELKNLDPLWPSLIKVMGSKSPLIRKTCMNVFKEAYLWLGPQMDPQISKLNKAQEKEFNNYKDQVSPSAMKTGQEKVKKAKQEKQEKEEKQEKQEKQIEQKNQQSQEFQKRGSKIQNLQPRQSDLMSLNIKENFSEDISYQEAVEKMIDRSLFKNVHEDFSIEEIEQIEDLDDLRVSLLSEKNLQLENKDLKAQIILLHLKQILKITNDFKDMNKVQNKQLYNILNQIIAKFDAECINQYVVNVYSVFFIEQMQSNCKEDLFKLFQTLTNQKEKSIIGAKDLTDQIFDIVQKKNYEPSKDLVCSLARVIETEIVTKQNISAISTNKLLKFIKNQKSLLQEDQEIKDRIFNLMRNIQDNFGKTSLSEYPPSLMKEFEAQNKEIEKTILKTIQKLKEKNVEKRKQALLELVDVKDYTQMQMLWENKEFQNFIKRSLITETQNEYYQKIIQIIENYLQFQRESPADFNLKHYLYVFHTIITQYYDIKEDEEKYENKKRLHILQNIFKKTTDWLEPTIIFNQLINDINAQNWREQICGFYLEYQESIELEPSFMDYIIEAYQHFKQSEGEKTRSQIEKVIISLKNCKNEEIQNKGNKNRNIKKIWQQSEEQILFGEDFLEFEGVFRNKGFYNSIKKFILKALDMNESNFYSLRIDSIKIDDAKNTSTKPKLAYFYLRSNENLTQISEHILNQINSINMNKLDQVSILIIFKTLINIMKNNYYCRQDSLYEDTIETFMNLIQLNRLTVDDIEIMNLIPSEKKVYSYAINYSQLQAQEEIHEGNDVDPSMIGGGMDDTYMMQDQNQTYEHNVSFNQYPPRDQISITTPQESAFRKKYNARQDDMSHNDNPRILDDYSQNLQSQKSYYSKQSQRNLQRLRSNNVNIDLQMELNIKLEGMLSFDMSKVEEESQDQNNLQLLASQMNNIFKVFIEMFEAIFDGGINYDVEKDSYELIFEPIKQIISNSDILVNLSQDMLNRMVEEVLNKLVSCNEEKVLYEKAEPNKDFFEYCDLIVKYFNGIMLRLLKNIDFNKILESLFLLLFHYNNLQDNDLDKKIFDLDLLCINRVTNRMSQVIDQVDPALVLKQIDSYETQIGINNPQCKKGSQIIKMMLRELVNNFTPEEVWSAYGDIYGNVPDQSNIIFTFINILQKNNQSKLQEQSYSGNQDQLLQLIEMINRDTSQQQLVFYEKKIFEIINNDPQINLRVYGGYFQNKQFFNYLVQKWEQYRAQGNNQQRMDDILNQSSAKGVINNFNFNINNGMFIGQRQKNNFLNSIKQKSSVIQIVVKQNLK